MSSDARQAYPSAPNAITAECSGTVPMHQWVLWRPAKDNSLHLLVVEENSSVEGLLPHRRASDVLSMNEKLLTSGIVAFPGTSRYKSNSPLAFCQACVNLMVAGTGGGIG